MPELKRPDGAQIHWEQRGEGPLVLLALQFFGPASLLQALIEDLERDHRVVTFDPRAVGRSTGKGLLDFDTDSEDIIALLEELGGPALIIPMGDGIPRAVKAAAARPDLTMAVLSPAGSPVGRQAAQGSEALAGSDSVIDALMGMIATDYRGALRTLFTTVNPQMNDEQVRERMQTTLDYCPQEVAVERMNLWVDADVLEESRQLGDRLWLLEHGTNPWFPKEILGRTRELLPDAQIVEVEDGVLSRPDITASYARKIIGAQSAVASKSGNQSL